MRAFAITILLLSCSVATAAVHQVEVPAHLRWCKTVTVVEKDMHTTDAQASIFRNAVKPIEDCARAAKLINIGIPYFASSAMSEGEDGTRKGDVTFCAVVSTDIEPPCADAAVAKISVAPQQVLAVVCAEDKVDACQAEIRTALQAAPFNADKDAIENLSWRFVQPQIVTADPATTIVRALTNASGNRVDLSGKDVPVSFVPPKAVVIAASVPSPKPAPPQATETPQ